MNNLKAFLIEEIKGLTFTTVNENDSLLKAKVLDSISVVDLIVAIEDKTGLHIPTGEIENNFETVNHIVSYLEKKSAQ